MLEIVLGIAGVVAAGMILGMVYQKLGTRRDAKRYAPLGRLVDIGTHRLHVVESGLGSPTVLLESGLMSTVLSWTAPDSDAVEIHIGSPDGKLFAQSGNRGSMPTGTWVPDGMTFYLQDVSGGKPLISDNTLATLVVHLQKM